ncbi:hypothetical protein OJ252_951 [Cryptosporidium canis]|uniref:Uncharacterized protein n=1 Tax=Cryptosporidium canis TaxID=195482 RepID=A0ABQ8P9L1_9CRYT|nr:hypothetical protein OJ252_951 [Cryptosporidium canis]
MRNINFSSSSSDNLARSSTSRRQLYDQNIFIPSNSLASSNNTIQDHRFLSKPVNRLEDNGIFSNFAQSNYSSSWRQTSSTQTRSLNDCLNKNPVNGKPIEDNKRTVRTPYPHIFKSTNYSKNEINSSDNNLSLLPPSRFPINSVTRGVFNRPPDSVSNYSIGSKGDEQHKDPNMCKKRNLHQVYKQKDDPEIDEDEFHDAISGDEGFNAEQLNNPNKKPNIIPQKNILIQTPSTVAQTGVLGTQNNTPNKPKNSYGLPPSMIYDDYRHERTPKYDFNIEKSHTSQKQSGNLDLTQYSHPYNFPKTPFLPPNSDNNSNAHPSIQRIRTPLRYRSSLLSALSNRVNSSCRILSAAEMKKVFCKSKRPIGSLKDFVHTIEVRNEESNETKITSDLSKMTEKCTDVIHSYEEYADDDFKVSFIEDYDENQEEVTTDSNVDRSNKSFLCNFNIPSNTKETTSVEKPCYGEPIDDTYSENALHVTNISHTKDSDLIASQDIQDPVNNIVDSTKTITEKKDSTKETEDDTTEANASQNKEPDNTESKKDEAVPWWLANVGKPNLVEVDNDGVFMPDEEDEKPKDEEKPKASAIGLFSIPPIEEYKEDNIIDPLPPSSDTCKIAGSSAPTGNSLFGPSLLPFTKAGENSDKTEEQKPSEDVSSLPVSNVQTNIFSFNQNSNVTSGFSLFGTSKHLEVGNSSESGNSISNQFNSLGKDNADSSSIPHTSIFESKAPSPEKNLPESTSNGIFGANISGSLFTSSNTSSGLSAPQPGSNINQSGTSNISGSATSIFNTKDIFNISSSANGLIAPINSGKQDSHVSIFGSNGIENKDPSSDVSLTGSSNMDQFNSLSNSNLTENTTEPKPGLIGGLFDKKTLGFSGNTESAITAPNSLFGGSSTTNNSLGQTNSLFSISPNNSSVMSSLNPNSNPSATTNNPFTTPINSIFGAQQASMPSSNPATKDFNFSSNPGISDSTNSLTSPGGSTSIFSQTQNIFGSSSSLSPFVFGSNNSQNEKTTNQTPMQGLGLGLSPAPNIFGSAPGIFNSSGKTETNIFGGMPSNPVASPFDPKPQVSTHSTANTNIFGTSPSNLFGAPTLMGGSTGSNPFVGHSSNPTGGTSHRRRIARAKRSH